MTSNIWQMRTEIDVIFLLLCFMQIKWNAIWRYFFFTISTQQGTSRINYHDFSSFSCSKWNSFQKIFVFYYLNILKKVLENFSREKEKGFFIKNMHCNAFLKRISRRILENSDWNDDALLWYFFYYFCPIFPSSKMHGILMSND